MQVSYRGLQPTPQGQQVFEDWLGRLAARLQAGEDRNRVVSDTLLELYGPAAPPVSPLLAATLDPRNVTLEPEYYGDIDAARYAERKPLIWLWMMFDRSPAGLNHWLGFQLRRLLAGHIFRHCGANVKIFHGVEFSFGYNLTVEDDCVIHKYVLLDDRGEIILRRGTSISDYANVYSHSHALLDPAEVTNHRTEIGPRARVTYHATVLSGQRVGPDAMVGAMAVVTHPVAARHVVGGIPARLLKVKP